VVLIGEIATSTQCQRPREIRSSNPQQKLVYRPDLSLVDDRKAMLVDVLDRIPRK